MVDLVKNKWTFSIILVVTLSVLSIFLFGFKLANNKTPTELYAVYLEGEKIGVVKSKEAFEEYINDQEETLRKKYNVSKIYTPNGVEIKKIVNGLFYDGAAGGDAKFHENDGGLLPPATITDD